MTTQVDELIQMPNNCKTCGMPWNMTVGEKQFFEKMMNDMAAKGKEFSMPTHCRDCRNAKKGSKVSPEAIISKIGSMMRKADAGEYALEIDDLVADLKNVQSMLKTMFPKERKRNGKGQTEAVGEPTQSGSVQTES